MSITTCNGRTFDREISPQHPGPEFYPVSRMLAGVYISQEDKVLQAQIDALGVRVAALEGHQPAPVPTPTPPGAPAWVLGVYQDQQHTGMCVGYGNSNWLASTPRPVAIHVGAGDQETATADVVYDKAQDEDGSPEDPNTGATILGGAKALKALGYITAYHWAMSVADVAAALTVCPGVLGISWKDSMFSPDAEGIIHYAGTTVGGHCIEVLNHNTTRGLFELPNSWGPSWGRSGRCFVPEADLAKMLADQGECVFYTR